MSALHHMRRTCGLLRSCCLALVLLTIFGTNAALARVPDARERGVLDFIGGIESNGYDDYYREVSRGPPRPLTSMTVGEVLDWQDSIDASSRSEAAGRYQIMEDTLRGLVREGAVSPDARFDAATQDALALQLLERRGWDPARTDYTNMGNAIAHEWAALPLCSGMRQGRSAYDGLAGNSARTTCEAWLSVLENGADPTVVADALAASHTGGGGNALANNALDRFIREFKETFYGLSDDLGKVATSLLISLLLIEWVWTTANQVGRGAGVGEYLSTLTQRIALAATFLFIINIGNYSDLIIRSAEALLDLSSERASINVIDLFDRILVLVFELFGRSWFGIGEKFAAIVILVLGTMLIGLILIAYMEVYLAFAAAIVALGFAGWSGTRHIAVRYLKRAAGRVLKLFTALFCGALVSELVTLDVSESSGDPFLLAGIMVVLAMVMMSAPVALEKALFGYAGPSSANRFAKGIGGTPFRLFKKLVGQG